MAITNFDPQIWLLHRKLFHRYMKNRFLFDRTTQEIPSYKKALAEETNPPDVDESHDTTKEVVPPTISTTNLINLITSSSDEGSDASEDED